MTFPAAMVAALRIVGTFLLLWGAAWVLIDLLCEVFKAYPKATGFALAILGGWLALAGFIWAVNS